MFYDIFLRVCENKGVSPSKVLTSLGASKGALANWKNGIEPRNETKKKIADYFGITVRELMDTQKENAPVPKSEDDMADVLEELRRRPEMKMLFSLSKNATPADVRKTVKFMETFCGRDKDE